MSDDAGKKEKILEELIDDVLAVWPRMKILFSPTCQLDPPTCQLFLGWSRDGLYGGVIETSADLPQLRDLLEEALRR